ncbi:MAG: pimeloyl-ACP methyl ester carboxylesterase [Limisphaerales bacterium]
MEKAILMGPAGFTGIRLDPGLLLSFGRPFINSSDTNVASFLKYTILGPGHKLNEEYFALLNKMFQVSFKHFKPGAQIPYVFSDEEIELLNAPVLLLCGENDALFSSNKTVNRAKALLPNLRHTELIPELGHAIGNYSLVIKHIKKFIQDSSK